MKPAWLRVVYLVPSRDDTVRSRLVELGAEAQASQSVAELHEGIVRLLSAVEREAVEIVDVDEAEAPR